MATKKKKVAITPKEFERRMVGIVENHKMDVEHFHSKADDLLCEVLDGLGYKKGVALYKTMTRHYA